MTLIEVENDISVGKPATNSESDVQRQVILDKNLLHHKLLELFVSVEYQRYAPINTFDCNAKCIENKNARAIEMYQREPMFHARVDHLAAYVLAIINECEK